MFSGPNEMPNLSFRVLNKHFKAKIQFHSNSLAPSRHITAPTFLQQAIPLNPFLVCIPVLFPEAKIAKKSK